LNDAIWAAIIAAAASVISNIILSRKQATEMDHKMEIRQAVTDTKLEELTREVRKHNNFAERMPVVEEQISILHETTEQLRRYHMQ
jgi:uncharacterized membrane protein YecN with MAPEG domain